MKVKVFLLWIRWNEQLFDVLLFHVCNNQLDEELKKFIEEIHQAAWRTLQK